jgi:MoxR-like ATPase
VHLSPDLRRYIVALAQSTRDSDAFSVGISPRGSLALAQACRAWAWMQGRDHVLPEDVLTLLKPVGAHRTVPADPRVQADHDRVGDLLIRTTETVPAPV